MKAMIQGLLILSLVVCLGCQTTQGGGSTAPASSTPSASSSDGKMLTDADYKRLGIKETYEDR